MMREHRYIFSPFFLPPNFYSTGIFADLEKLLSTFHVNSFKNISTGYRYLKDNTNTKNNRNLHAIITI